MRKAFTLFASTLLCIYSHAVTKTAQSNPNNSWSVATNWSPVGIPQDGDEVIIPAGIIISVKGSMYTTAANLKIYVHGTLDFDPSGKLNLGINSIVQLAASSSKITTNGSASEQIIIGGGLKYSGANDGEVTGPAFTTFSSPNSSSTNARAGFSFGVLPVKLTSFTAQQTNGQILLQWTTAMEEGLKHFELQQSADGKAWNTIATLQSKNNCACTTNYNYKDLLAEPALNYYRLRSVDWDGNTDLSNVLMVKSTPGISQADFAIVNRVGSTVTLKLNAPGVQFPVQLQLLTSSGQVIMSKSITSPLTTLDIQSIPGGFAVLHLNDQRGRKKVMKIIK